MKIKRLLNILVATVLLFVISGLNQPVAAQCSHCDHGYIYISRSSGTYGVTRDKKKCPMCGDYYCVGESHVHRCPYCSGDNSSSSSSSYDDEGDFATTESTDPIDDGQVRVRGEFADDPTMAIHKTGFMPQNQQSQSDDVQASVNEKAGKWKKKKESNTWIWVVVIIGGVVVFMWLKD